MTRHFIKKLMASLTLSIALVGVCAAPMAYADEGDESTSGIPTITKPDLLPGPDEDQSQSEVQEYFRNEAIPTFISGFLGLIGAVALISLMFSGIRFMTAYGDEEAITKAKRNATWAVVGLGIAMLSYTIVAIINTLSFPDGEYEQPTETEIIYESI